MSKLRPQQLAVMMAAAMLWFLCEKTSPVLSFGASPFAVRQQQQQQARTSFASFVPLEAHKKLWNQNDNHPLERNDNSQWKMPSTKIIHEWATKSALSFLLAATTLLATATPGAHADEGMLAPTMTTTSTTSTVLESSATSSSSPQQQVEANVRAGLSARRYWNIMASTEEGAEELRIQANEALLDHAVGTVNTMYYDNTGGARFVPLDFYDRWRSLRDEIRQASSTSTSSPTPTTDGYDKNVVGKTTTLATREGAVQNLKWLISTLDDPFSKYMTREEMYREFNTRYDGFLGMGAVVETPEQGDLFFARGSLPTLAVVIPDDDDANPTTKRKTLSHRSNHNHNTIKKKGQQKASKMKALSASVVNNLPVVTAVSPYSPAERAGITVGDRIVAVGEYSFLGQSRSDVSSNFQSRFASGTNYFGTSDVTIAKPVVRTLLTSSSSLPTGDTTLVVGDSSSTSSAQPTSTISTREREVVIGYRQTRVRLPTQSLQEDTVNQPTMLASSTSNGMDSTNGGTASVSSMSSVNMMAEAVGEALMPPTKGGNSIVHWELISEESQPSIFQRSRMKETVDTSSSALVDNADMDKTASERVGYIRLTRFSRASTSGYLEAVEALEKLGATSYIIDLRNNYGGIIQEAMLTASTLLRDPHAVLCYTLNSRGGFTPHDVEEYVVDKRYPGYLLSMEPRSVTLTQAQRENPDMFDDNGSRWVPPSAYASLHEQTTTRGLHRPVSSTINEEFPMLASSSWLQWNSAAANAYASHSDQWLAQRNMVVLINEGTASAAEVFASALHDNGRTLALIGSRTYGKGLIQHTFPMPDGGGLKLTVAEYLTPALRHMTVVGNARFDSVTGEQVGGGIKPDIYCASRQGIPSNIGADLCVGVALDVLQEAESASYSTPARPEKAKLQPQRFEHPGLDGWMKNGVIANKNVGSSTDSASILSASSDVVVTTPDAAGEGAGK